jgi:hypothetical protein
MQNVDDEFVGRHSTAFRRAVTQYGSETQSITSVIHYFETACSKKHTHTHTTHNDRYHRKPTLGVQGNYWLLETGIEKAVELSVETSERAKIADVMKGRVRSFSFCKA